MDELFDITMSTQANNSLYFHAYELLNQRVLDLEAKLRIKDASVEAHVKRAHVSAKVIKSLQTELQKQSNPLNNSKAQMSLQVPSLPIGLTTSEVSVQTAASTQTREAGTSTQGGAHALASFQDAATSPIRPELGT